MCKNCSQNKVYEILGIEPIDNEQIFLGASEEVIKENAESIKQFIKIARNYSYIKELSNKSNENTTGHSK